MNAQAANPYLRTRVMTATPEQLQMMLYDGAIRFCEQARVALGQSDFEGAYNSISRVQRIMLEMSCALKHEVAPDLCGKLAALYNYAHRKLIEASVRRDMASLDEALDVLRYQRETWQMLMEKLGQQNAARAAGRIDLPSPNERMEASISLQA